MCTDNVTDLSRNDLQNKSGGPTNQVESFICQSTIIPSDGRGFRTALSSQSVSLADIFLGKCLRNRGRDAGPGGLLVNRSLSNCDIKVQWQGVYMYNCGGEGSGEVQNEVGRDLL